jgi:hypothetical protein
VITNLEFLMVASLVSIFLHCMMLI